MTELKSISKIQFEFHGCLDYQKAFELQLNRHQTATIENFKCFVLALEHPAVLTLGHRAHAAEEILAGGTLPVVQSTRGGLATIHSEGQLVIYPILHLKHHNLGVRTLVEKLLRATQECFRHYGVNTKLDEKQIGLFTERGKIAFCGLQIKQGVSLHGISINLNNDLNLFKQIIPCGVQLQEFDQLSNYQENVQLEDFFIQWQKSFYNLLYCEVAQ